MKIGLLTDASIANIRNGKIFPNLALMKISAYHKLYNDDVEFLYPLAQYDRVYYSKVFDYTKFVDYEINCEDIIIGGSGYDYNISLPAEIENIYPDYGLYNIFDNAYGYLTRGCPRDCGFCIVSKKEGMKNEKVNNLENFWKGQKYITLLDSNFTANKNRNELLYQLIESKSIIEFNQGLDIRMIDEEFILMLDKIKLKNLHFAWDLDKQEDLILKNLLLFKNKSAHNIRSIGVYVLTNYNTDFEYDLFRVNKLREIGYSVFVMVYDKQNADKKYKVLQRWANGRMNYWGYSFYDWVINQYGEYKFN